MDKPRHPQVIRPWKTHQTDRKSTRLNSSHGYISYAVFCLKKAKDKIYNQYLEAFKKGAYDILKEDYDPTTQQIIPRKYFSGGAIFGDLALLVKTDPAMLPKKSDELVVVSSGVKPIFKKVDHAMIGAQADNLFQSTPLKSLKREWKISEEEKSQLISWLESEELLPQAELFHKFFNYLI